MDYGYVIKFNNNQFNVFVDLNDYYSGYGVIPKEKDPENAYDIEDVRAYCETHPDMVLNKHPMKDKIKLIQEKDRLESWLKEHDYIGVKIATGRATVEDYANEIALMAEKANRINEIDELLK